MLDLNRAMKLSLTFGLTGALLMPVIYEIYANVSQNAGLCIAGIWVIFIGIKLSSLSFREAIIGITCTIAYTAILGFVAYMMIHPAVTNMLMKRSVYFQLSLKAQFQFVAYCFWIFLGIYGIWVARFALGKAIAKFKSNSEETGAYIDNAFNDEGDEK